MTTSAPISPSPRADFGRARPLIIETDAMEPTLSRTRDIALVVPVDSYRGEGIYAFDDNGLGVAVRRCWAAGRPGAPCVAMSLDNQQYGSEPTVSTSWTAKPTTLSAPASNRRPACHDQAHLGQGRSTARPVPGLDARRAEGGAGMSTAQERAAARIAAIIAEGHSITLIRAAYRDGEDGVFTALHVAQPGPIDVQTAALAAEFQHGDAEDRAALKVELISRGLVQ